MSCTQYHRSATTEDPRAKVYMPTATRSGGRHCSHGTHTLQAKMLVQNGTKESWASPASPSLILHIILQSKQNISGSLRGENIYFILRKHHEWPQLSNLTRCHFFLWRQAMYLSDEQKSLWTHFQRRESFLKKKWLFHFKKRKKKKAFKWLNLSHM